VGGGLGGPGNVVMISPTRALGGIYAGGGGLERSETVVSRLGPSDFNMPWMNARADLIGGHLLAGRMLAKDSTVGMSLTGALTPAGYGKSCLVPLIEAGFIDWMISTGANLYHDTHHAIGLKLHRGSPHADDVALRAAGVVRIYDIVFDYTVLLDTDRFFRQVMPLPEFDKPKPPPKIPQPRRPCLRARGRKSPSTANGRRTRAPARGAPVGAEGGGPNAEEPERDHAGGRVKTTEAFVHRSGRRVYCRSCGRGFCWHLYSSPSRARDPAAT